MCVLMVPVFRPTWPKRLLSLGLNLRDGLSPLPPFVGSATTQRVFTSFSHYCCSGACVWATEKETMLPGIKVGSDFNISQHDHIMISWKSLGSQKIQSHVLSRCGRSRVKSDSVQIVSVLDIHVRWVEKPSSFNGQSHPVKDALRVFIRLWTSTFHPGPKA